jgi:hypothetical protein
MDTLVDISVLCHSDGMLLLDGEQEISGITAPTDTFHSNFCISHDVNNPLCKSLFLCNHSFENYTRCTSTRNCQARTPHQTSDYCRVSIHDAVPHVLRQKNVIAEPTLYPHSYRTASGMQLKPLATLINTSTPTNSRRNMLTHAHLAPITMHAKSVFWQPGQQRKDALRQRSEELDDQRAR